MAAHTEETRQQRKPGKRRDYLRDIRAIHALQRQLDMSDDDARSLKQALTGTASSKDMNAPQRKRLLAHLLRLRDLRQGKTPTIQTGSVRPALWRSGSDWRDDRWKLACRLWTALFAVGQVRTNTDTALQAWVKRQSGVDTWRWLNTYQINSVIEALKKWCTRAGINTSALEGDNRRSTP